MKTFRGSKDPRILNLGISADRMSAHSHVLAVIPQREELPYTEDGTLGGPQTFFDHGGEEKVIVHAGNPIHFTDRLIPNVKKKKECVVPD
jgi:hypothetical protein